MPAKSQGVNTMKIAGLILIVMGIVDFGGSWVGFDLWGGFFGIELPALVWQFSAYVEIAIGYFLLNAGSGSAETVSE
jgi:uncharacterized membrane protein YphA (DoxX/SURF4 family)